MPFLDLDPLALEQAREMMEGVEGWRKPAQQQAPEIREAQEVQPEPAVEAAQPHYLPRRPADAIARGWLARLLAISGTAVTGTAHA